MLATGTGTTLSSLPDYDPGPLIIISPGARVSTGTAYESLRAAALTSDTSKFILSSSQNTVVSEESAPWLLNDFANDFESVIFDIYPEIGRAKERLIAAGARAALLAGSGSRVFGVFGDHKSQQLALDEIQVEGGWRIIPCVPLSRNEYRSAVGDELFRSYAL